MSAKNDAAHTEDGKYPLPWSYNYRLLSRYIRARATLQLPHVPTTSPLGGCHRVTRTVYRFGSDTYDYLQIRQCAVTGLVPRAVPE
jgi:hypothetical protein